MQLVSTCLDPVPNLFAGEEKSERNIFTWLDSGGNEKEIWSSLPTIIIIIFFNVGII